MRPLDLSPVTLLLQEVQTVTSAMRRNTRWSASASASSSSAHLPPHLSRGRRAGTPVQRKHDDEGDLMQGFVDLRRSLTGVTDVTTLDPYDIVSPFLAIVSSRLPNGASTTAALVSLHSLVLHVLPLYLPDSPPPAISEATPLQLALVHMTKALTACRFPSSSPQQDELVLLRLLRVIEALSVPILPDPSSSVRTPQSLLDHISDEGVCELLEVGLGMLSRGRLSDGLRSTAQMCVQAITRQCFLRLHSISPEDVERALNSRTNAVKDTVNVPADAPGLSEQATRGSADADSPGENETNNGDASATEVKVSIDSEAKVDADASEKDARGSSDESSKSDKTEGKAKSGKIESARASQDEQEKRSTEQQPEDVGPQLFSPYGLPTMLELLRVLIALLNPNDMAHTDTLRMSVLAVVNSALEVGGSGIGRWPELREGIRDEGCRYLFQLTRSDQSALLAQSLRTTSTLFATLLPHMKLQLELFLSYLVDRLTPPAPSALPQHLRDLSRPTSPSPFGDVASDSGADTPSTSTPKPYAMLPPMSTESKELWLETLTQTATRPSFMVDCWVNFDCSTDSEDIFERLIAFLTRGVYPAVPARPDGTTMFEGLDNVQLLCLEILLSYINSMANRLEQGDEPWPSDVKSVEELKAAKARKAVLIEGTTQFNIKPKRGVQQLLDSGVIVPDSGEGTQEERELRAIARFLRTTSRLDKKLVGEYISERDRGPLLKAYIGQFDFAGKSIADALRELLETFRLPGEAGPIGNITETFSQHFFSFNPPEIASADAAYVLAYSVIMLNTDQHNPQNRKRMTVEDYQRNLRGVNDRKDFDPEYLAAIHESIRKHEIILPEEHVGQPGFDYAWKSLMQRTRLAGSTISCNTSKFDQAMFSLSWQPLVGAIAYAFTMSAGDEHVIQHSITGFRQCATLAGHFKMPEVFDRIVLSLAPATGLLDETEDGYQMGNYPTAERDGLTLTVSPLAIRFGQSYRAQLATVVLFTIANGNGNAIRSGWSQIFEMFQTLFLHSLLPTQMLQMEDFLAGTTTIPLKASTPAVAPERRPEGGGLLSTLSSYLLSPYGASTEVVVMEVNDDDIENALVAVDSLASCKLEELYAEILNLEVDALIPALQAIRTLAEARTTQRLQPRQSPDGPQRFDGQLPYDPACVFLLEMMVSLASRGKQHIAETWPIIFEYISALLNSAQSYSVLLIERAVVGLLRLCLSISENPSQRDQLYLALDVLRSLPSSVLNAVSEQLMAGVAKILEKDAGVVKSQTEWGLIIALFRATVAHPEASKVTLTIVQKMATGGEPGLSVDNFAGVVALLDEFATAAGAAAAGRNRQNRRGGGPVATLGPTVERGLTALDSLYELRNVIPQLIAKSHKPPREAFSTFWLPPLLVISKQCVNGHREIRQRAISYLQRLLLSPQLMSADESTLPIIFDRVLFPVLDELLKPAVYERDAAGAVEMRLRAATLLCKVFLQYVVGLEGPSPAVGAQFVRVLDKLERFMQGDRDMLNEVSESLKNVVLVMYSSQLLMPPPANGPDTRSREQQELWAASAPRVERMVPGFLGEALAPPEPEQKPRPSADAAAKHGASPNADTGAEAQAAPAPAPAEAEAAEVEVK